MNDLDKKLVEILETSQGFIDDDEIKASARSAALTQIRQAFKDAGWINTWADNERIQDAVNRASIKDGWLDNSPEIVIPRFR